MIYVSEGSPVLIYYSNNAVKTVNTATLLNDSDEPLSTVTPLDASVDDVVKWGAFFDPELFVVDEEYKISWVGVDENGDDFTDVEDNISVKKSNSFYSSFFDSLRRSLMDDGTRYDYPLELYSSAVAYAVSFFNAQPPVTTSNAEGIPLHFLIDLSKIYLYRGLATREAMDTFSYNDIGKAFNLDRSPRLQALAQSLEASIIKQLEVFKRNLRPQIIGLRSRYARHTGRSVRSNMYDRIIYRGAST